VIKELAQETMRIAGETLRRDRMSKQG
jgi:hypothetical protein